VVRVARRERRDEVGICADRPACSSTIDPVSSTTKRRSSWLVPSSWSVASEGVPGHESSERPEGPHEAIVASSPSAAEAKQRLIGALLSDQIRDRT